MPAAPPPFTCSLGTLESAKGVYESMLDLRIATAQVVLNYAALMLEHKFFEEAFRWVAWAGELAGWLAGWLGP